MLSAAISNSTTTGSTSADVVQDYGPLPTLLSSNTHNVNGFLHLIRDDRFFKPAKVLKGSDSGPAQTNALESAKALKEEVEKIRSINKQIKAHKNEEEIQAKADAEMKGFVAGAHIEYYSKSCGQWIPAVIGEIHPNGCLKLLYDDASLLKMQADPKSVRLAREGAKSRQCAPAWERTWQADPNSVRSGCYEGAKFNTCFNDDTSAMCSRAASGIRHANAEQSSSEASDSIETYDQQMKLLHSRSEKCDDQLRIHRGLSQGMAQDEQLDLSHLAFRHSLSKAMGPDMANAMRSSDELMRQMNLRHGISSIYDQQLKLDRSLSEVMGSQAM